MAKMDSKLHQIVESMLLDQDECVTVARLVTALKISRSDANELLSSVSSKILNCRATFITSKTTTTTTIGDKVVSHEMGDDEETQAETIPCTVFSMKSQKTNSNNMVGDDTPFLYALTPDALCQDNNKHVVASTHERTLAQWRDAIRDCDTQLLESYVKASQDVIQSAENEEAVKARWDNYREPNTDVGAMSVSRSSSSNAMAMKNKKTAVGRSAFFNSLKTKDSSSQSQEAPASSKLMRIPSSSNKNATTARHKEQTTKPQEEKENNNKQQMAPPTVQRHDKQEKKRNVGNADDFVGDLDEDDDDEEEDDVFAESAPSPKKIKITEKNTTKSESEQKEEVMQVDDDAQKVEVNLKTISVDKASNEQPRRRPKRKKLVEKTTMDASGYLHTETQEVWEEIPSDEDDIVTKQKVTTKKKHCPKVVSNNNTKKKKAVTKNSGMKQGKIMSFFKK